MTKPRFDTLDALRGVAMVWMTLFHFSFDLNHFGYIHQNFYTDPVWTWQRTFIVCLFLFCAGLRQAVAVVQGQSWPRFWRRWAQIAVCALLVTLGSWWMYPQTFIYFGVLHGMALMLIVARLTAHWGRWLWLLGGLAIASKFIAANALSLWAGSQFVAQMNAPALNWLGWITRKPITEDYVPLFPWLGVLWWGVATGLWLLREQPDWLAGTRTACHLAAFGGVGPLELELLHAASASAFGAADGFHLAAAPLKQTRPVGRAF